MHACAYAWPDFCRGGTYRLQRMDPCYGDKLKLRGGRAAGAGPGYVWRGDGQMLIPRRREIHILPLFPQGLTFRHRIRSRGRGAGHLHDTPVDRPLFTPDSAAAGLKTRREGRKPDCAAAAADRSAAEDANRVAVRASCRVSETADCVLRIGPEFPRPPKPGFGRLGRGGASRRKDLI